MGDYGVVLDGSDPESGPSPFWGRNYPATLTPSARPRIRSRRNRRIASLPRDRNAALLHDRFQLYSSHLVVWRAARDRGELAGLTPKKRGPQAQEPNPLARELAAKEREIAHLKAENAKLQIICEVQKKVSLLLGVTLPTIPEDGKSTKGSS